MVEFFLVPAYYTKEIVLDKKALDFCKKYRSIALFAAVQFIKLEKVISQLKDIGITAIESHGKRTSGKFQLLGFDCFSGSFSPSLPPDAGILYIGDGLFHPKALEMAHWKNVGMYTPIAGAFSILTPADLDRQRKKYKANLLRFMNARKIGILVSTKTGQQYLKNALLLKEKLPKDCFIFVGDTFNYPDMENYPFIEAWVNTACPRIGTDDIVHMAKPPININDALAPEKALEQLSW